MINWDAIVDEYAVGQIRTAVVIRLLNTGYLVDIGINVILPLDRSTDDMRATPNGFLGRTIQCRIEDIDPRKRNIQLSVATSS